MTGLSSRIPALCSVLLVLAFSIAFPMACSMACSKSQAACENTAQCETGFACSESGKCEATGGLDADLDPADAAAACPEATHFCAAAVPADWQGPVAGTQASSGGTLADCSGDYATEARAVFEALVAEGACSCSCPGFASAVTCGNAQIRSSGTSALTCPQLCAGDCSISLTPNAPCTFVQAGVFDKTGIRIGLGSVTGSGTCDEAAQVSDNLSSRFASRERYCSADAIAASCPADGLCMPNVIEPAFGSMCIFQQGDHECPESYPAKEVRYEGFEDTRACSTCSCTGPNVGSTCGGHVQIGGTASCDTIATVTSTGCIANPLGGPGTSGARYQPGTSFGCSATGGEITGEATETGQTTFCCTEAIADPNTSPL